MSEVHYQPEDFPAITPYLVLTDAPKCIEFLKQAFDATVDMIFEMPDGTIGHAELTIADSKLFLADATEQWKPMPTCLHFYVPNVDESYHRAVEVGGESLQEPADQFYGERSAHLKDPTGNIWHLSTRIEILSEEEMKKRAEELFGDPT